VAANVTDVAPAGTVTLAGTVSAVVLLLDRVTTNPPAGAGALIDTVPVTAVPTRPDNGLTDSVEIAAGVTVTDAVFELPDRVAVIVTVVEMLTGFEVTGAVTDVAPAGTVMVAGTLAAALLLERATATPLVPAAALMVTVAVPFCAPPRRLVGLMASDATEKGLTVSVADAESPFAAAEMVTEVAAPTWAVVMVNVAVVEPAGTETVAGTTAAGLSLVTVVVKPPAGATPVSEIVPTAESNPPIAVERLRVNVSIRVGVTTSEAVFVTLRAVAAIVTAFSGPLYAVVVRVNDVLRVFASTVTEMGTVTTGSPLVSCTTNPPLAARPFRVTVPVTGDPPPTDVRESVRLVSAGGLMTNVA
jgi:hypothetical protein